MNAIRVAQTVGLTAAGFCAGGTLCLSYIVVPSLLLAPYPLIVRQWKRAFDTGKIAHPLLAIVSSLAYGFLAYQMQGTLNQARAELYGLAAVANLAIFPWTMLVMMPTNHKLFKKIDDANAMDGTGEISEVGLGKGESSKELLDKWSTMNVVRACMPLLGTILGAWATLN